MHLGFMYSKGEDVPEYLVQARMWSSIAASQGNMLAAVLRDTLTLRMTKSQIAEAEKLARNLGAQCFFDGVLTHERGISEHGRVQFLRER